MPMNRTLPSPCSSWSVSTVWFSSSVALLGDMCTWTRSRRSVRSLAQRLLDVGADVRLAVVVRVRRRQVAGGLDRAAALGGEEELVPAVADVGADELLAAAVVG